VAWSQEDAELAPIRADERYLNLIQKPQA